MNNANPSLHLPVSSAPLELGNRPLNLSDNQLAFINSLNHKMLLAASNSAYLNCLQQNDALKNQILQLQCVS
jgi:hypothetical protein